MNRFMIAAAAGLTMASTAIARPNVYVDTSSVHVFYGDLDLQSPAGRSQLRHRIQQASNLLCTAAGVDAASPFRLDCYRAARASALQQMTEIARR